jgi:hypothetical protein
MDIIIDELTKIIQKDKRNDDAVIDSICANPNLSDKQKIIAGVIYGHEYKGD